MLILLIVLALFGSLASVSVAVLSKQRASVMETRIQTFRNRNLLKDDLSVDLDIAFADRILKPSVERIANAFARILPQKSIADVQQQLTMAGNPMRLNTFLTFWAVAMGTVVFISVFVFTLDMALFPGKILIVAFLLAIGYVYPRTWLKSRVKAKQKLVLKALPDALDLITTCVEAGLGLDAALQRVADNSEGPFAEELTKMLRDVSMGKLRREAMQELGERIGVEELTNFINAIIQAEQLGVGIAQVLRVQSDQMRTARRQRAEKAAHEAPIKMLFPLVLFIFPAFLMVILGPAAIRITEAF
ncbi:MAG TPA: type II secretion system F family protein [Dehalococcoidia bacterium]|jgi:tight adherence protein C|nr:type II secretion system F family protein [Dehalococcoidia bacterium]